MLFTFRFIGDFWCTRIVVGKFDFGSVADNACRSEGMAREQGQSRGPSQGSKARKEQDNDTTRFYKMTK